MLTDTVVIDLGAFGTSLCLITARLKLSNDDSRLKGTVSWWKADRHLCLYEYIRLVHTLPEYIPSYIHCLSTLPRAYIAWVHCLVHTLSESDEPLQCLVSVLMQCRWASRKFCLVTVWLKNLPRLCRAGDRRGASQRHYFLVYALGFTHTFVY